MRVDAGYEEGDAVTLRPIPLLAVAVIGGIIYEVFHLAWPAISKFGLGFIWHEAWDPVTSRFGAIDFLYDAAQGMPKDVPVRYSLGMALAPGFPNDPYIYVLYTLDAPTAKGKNTPFPRPYAWNRGETVKCRSLSVLRRTRAP